MIPWNVPFLKNNGCILCILVVFCLSGVLYSTGTPLWNPPDEERHFLYSQYISRKGELPTITSKLDGDVVSQAIHPPLYYILTSLFCSRQESSVLRSFVVNDQPGYGILRHPQNDLVFPYAGIARSAYMIRFFSLLLSLANVLLMYYTVLCIFPGERVLASAATAFIATNPQFVYISGSVSNETLEALLSTALCYALVTYRKTHSRILPTAFIGVLLGLGLLSKITTLIFFPVSAGVVAWHNRNNIRQLISALFLLISAMSVISGWWYVPRFSALMHLESPHRFFLRGDELTLNYLMMAAKTSFISFFGYFGSLQFSLPEGYVVVYGVCLLVAGIGVFMSARRVLRDKHAAETLAIMFGLLLLQTCLFIWLNLKAYMYMGRLFFVVLTPLAVFFAAGLYVCFPRKVKNIFCVCIIVALAFLNIDVYQSVVKPAYAEPRLITGVKQENFDSCKVLNNRGKITQTFISPHNKLCGVQIMFAKHNDEQEGKVAVYIGEVGKGALFDFAFSLREIENTSRFYFAFPPVMNSKDKTYSISLHADCSEGGDLSVWYSSVDCYANGFMGSRKEEGDLYFSAYCFDGDVPVSVWEGVKPAVLDRQQYVTIKELQVYFDRDENARQATLTHEKLEKIMGCYSIERKVRERNSNEQ